MTATEFQILCTAVLCGWCVKWLIDLVGLSNLIGFCVGCYVWVELAKLFLEGLI